MKILQYISLKNEIDWKFIENKKLCFKLYYQFKFSNDGYIDYSVGWLNLGTRKISYLEYSMNMACFKL